MNALVLITLLAVTVAAAQPQIVLEHVSGRVAYAVSEAGAQTPVVGSLSLDAGDFAITRARSAGVLLLPDSSAVSLGEATRVRVGAFLMAHELATMRVSLMDGALHFAVRHPGGGRADYVFTTPTAQIAVRGTEGMIAVLPGETIVACVHGTNTDTEVTSPDGVRTYLPPGMTLRVRVGQGGHIERAMNAGINADRFAQFAGIVAKNHQSRMSGHP